EVPVDVGVKLTGKVGRTAVGVLDVRTRDSPIAPAKNFFAKEVSIPGTRVKRTGVAEVFNVFNHANYGKLQRPGELRDVRSACTNVGQLLLAACSTVRFQGGVLARWRSAFEQGFIRSESFHDIVGDPCDGIVVIVI